MESLFTPLMWLLLWMVVRLLTQHRLVPVLEVTTFSGLLAVHHSMAVELGVPMLLLRIAALTLPFGNA